MAHVMTVADAFDAILTKAKAAATSDEVVDLLSGAIYMLSSAPSKGGEIWMRKSTRDMHVEIMKAAIRVLSGGDAAAPAMNPKPE